MILGNVDHQECFIQHLHFWFPVLVPDVEIGCGDEDAHDVHPAIKRCLGLAPTGETPRGRLVAFAGLARPEKFFDTLIALGGDVREAAPFSDHHLYSDEDFALLTCLAEDHEARLITTEKDAARLTPAQRESVSVLPVTARFDDEGQLDALLAPIRSRMTGPHG